MKKYMLFKTSNKEPSICSRSGQLVKIQCALPDINGMEKMYRVKFFDGIEMDVFQSQLIDLDDISHIFEGIDKVPSIDEITVPVDITIRMRDNETEVDAKNRLHSLLQSELEGLADHDIKCKMHTEESCDALEANRLKNNDGKLEVTNTLPVPGSIVVFHRHICKVIDNLPEGTLLIDLAPVQVVFGDNNCFKGSSLDQFLNGPYLDDLTMGQTDEVIPRIISLTSTSGNDMYGAYRCKVAPLTLEEARRYSDIGLPLTARDFLVTPNDRSLLPQKQGVACFDACDAFGESGANFCNMCHPIHPAFLVSPDAIKKIL